MLYADQQSNITTKLYSFQTVRVKNCLEICVTSPEMIQLHVYESSLYRFITYYDCLQLFSKFSSINIINTMQCAAAFYVCHVQTKILHFLYDRNNIRMLSKQYIDFLLLIYKENTFLMVSIGNFLTLFVFFMFKNLTLICRLLFVVFKS